MNLDFIGRQVGPTPFTYTKKDVILYALGIGAQIEELDYLYEGVRGGLNVFASYAAIIGREALMGIRTQMGLDTPRSLHAEQRVKLHHPLPPEGTVHTIATMTHAYDKGKGKAAILLGESESFDARGELLFTTGQTIYYSGGGGFGGDPGPKAVLLQPPEDRSPAFEVTYPIPANQAALYRLSGDPNPLHIDPLAASEKGFPGPILHGLCTFGYAYRAILYGLCGGDAAKMEALQVRFAQPVFPGESLTVRGWEAASGRRYVLQGVTPRAVVLNNAFVTLHGA